MNIKQIAALLLLSASTGVALADVASPVNTPVAASSLTRADVIGQLNQNASPALFATGDANYPQLPVVQSVKSRKQVHADLASVSGNFLANPIYRGS